MLNPNSIINQFSEPFPHVIIDNFFETSFFNELESFFPKDIEFKDNNVNRMHGDTTYGDELYTNLINKSEAYFKLNEWVYSNDFFEYFLKFFNKYFDAEKDLMDNPNNFTFKAEPYEIGKVYNLNNFEKNNDTSYLYSRLDLGYGKERYGEDSGGRGPHIDNPQRLISILFYVGGFSKIDGGEHRMYRLSNDNKSIEVDKIIEPKKNTLIASLQNNLAFHDVNPIKEISGQRNAYYLAISASKRVWKPSKRNYINKKYNKNRVEKNILHKLINFQA